MAQTTKTADTAETTPAKKPVANGAATKDSDDNSTLDALRQQMDELRASLAGIASTIAASAVTAKDAVADAGRTTASGVTQGVKQAGQTAVKVKDLPAFEHVQTVATLAPVAATVVRRVPGGKKLVAAGLTAYAAYLIFDAIEASRAKADKAPRKA